VRLREHKHATRTLPQRQAAVPVHHAHRGDSRDRLDPASLGFSFYVSNFSSYSATYEALASVVVLLLYLFIPAAILLLGAEINAESYRAVAEKSGDGERQESG
jgi:hypothetical protein